MLDCQVTWSCPGFVQATTAAVSACIQCSCRIQKTVFHPGLPNFCLLQSFPPLPWLFLSLELGRRGCGINVPFRAEHVADTLHSDQWWASVSTSVYHTKTLLWWGLRPTLTCGYRGTYLEDILIPCPFSKIKAIGSPLGSLTPLTTSSWLDYSFWHESLSVEQLLNPIRRQLVTPHNSHATIIPVGTSCWWQSYYHY